MFYKDTIQKPSSGILCLLGIVGIGMINATLAFGDDDGNVQSLQSEVHELQDKVQALENKSSDEDKSGGPAFKAGPFTVKIGGYTELAMIYRNRNEAADDLSSFSGIPFANSPGYNASEFRESARQSRLSLLTQGPEVNGARGEAYFETDFLGAAQTANSKQSNSYNLRMRQIYADYTTGHGLQVLAGQAWSLLAMEKEGMSPRAEVVPLTIDASYVPGFNYTRGPQLRVVEKFNDKVSAGVSAETPQGLEAGAAPTGIDTTISAGSGFNSANTYSMDPLPDFIAKVALDPGFGHYELYALNRTFQASNNGRVMKENVTGVGGSAIVPIIPSKMELQLSVLTGEGVGRYSVSQLPDYTLDASGQIKPINETTMLVGLIGHPTDTLTLYGYAGKEFASSTAVSGKYGYGDDAVPDNTPCYQFGSTTTCSPQNKSISQATIGGWWKFYRGEVGNMQLGLQVSSTTRETFDAIKGGAPNSTINIVMASFRYYPYQN